MASRSPTKKERTDGEGPSEPPPPPEQTGNRRGKPGTLFIIGGAEDRDGDSVILQVFCQQVGKRPLVVTTVASHEPDALWEEYEPIFKSMGCKDVRHLRIDKREDALAEDAWRLLEGAGAVFFTGGDQLKITSQIGDTPVYRMIREIFLSGGVIGGTSAGASAMSETMLVSGESEASHRVGAALLMSAGLGLIGDVIIDQHFAQRGRIGRLLGAVAQNPRMLGLGIDEDTAIIVHGLERFEVLGSGAVYVLDGREITSSNLDEEGQERTMSVFNLRLHVLSQADIFALDTRRPTARPAEALPQRKSRR